MCQDNDGFVMNFIFLILAVLLISFYLVNVKVSEVTNET